MKSFYEKRSLQYSFKKWWILYLENVEHLEQVYCRDGHNSVERLSVNESKSENGRRKRA